MSESRSSTSSAKTLVLAALTSEVQPLIGRLALTRSPVDEQPAGHDAAPRPIVYRRRGAAVTVAVTGMGPERAEAVARSLCRALQPQRVIITGFAGAAHPALAVGDLIEPSVLLRQTTGQAYYPTAAKAATGTGPGTGGTLVTCDAPVGTPGEKARLREQFAADALDMESSAIAAVCQASDIPWTCVRAVTDTADQALPPAVAGLSRPTGEPDLFATLRYLLVRPLELPRLVRLGRGAARAAAALARRLDSLDGS